MLTLVDADIIIMRAAFGAETREKHVVDGELIITRDITSEQDVIDNVDVLLDNISREYSDSTALLFVSGGNNFRKRISEDYKANRKPEDKPLLLDVAKEYIMSLGGIELPYIEADDAMSIMQWRSLNKVDDWLDSDTVICTIDKDLNTVPGHHYNFVDKIPYWIDKEQAEYWYFTQLLIGDTGDNVKGIYRVGPKKAEKALFSYYGDSDAMYNVVSTMYEEKKTDKCGVLEDNYYLIGMLPDYRDVPMLEEHEQEELNEVFKYIIDEYEES